MESRPCGVTSFTQSTKWDSRCDLFSDLKRISKSSSASSAARREALMHFDSSRELYAGSADILSASSACRLEACAPGGDVRFPSKMRLLIVKLHHYRAVIEV